MSSVLAIRPDAAALTSSRHSYATSQMMLPHELGDRHSQLQHGLPTPPATSVMTCGRHTNGNSAWPVYQQAHDRLPVNRQPRDHQLPVPNTALQIPVPPPTYQHAYVSGSTRDDARIQPQEIAAHLQIPQSINNSKGSLPELAAQLTCLFWFETSETLEYAEGLPEKCPTKISVNDDAHPTLGFSKWVTTIVSTTQVARNVVVLALLFIYRLKKFNPSVSGKRGSEYRLLSIALMLGNKFLDDNTYTNKTWAEVSGISVNEIHIMEVEFLSNMRYELYASLEQWQEWKAKLGRLGSFYEKASLLGKSSKASSPVTPMTQTISTKLPSPPLRHTSGFSVIPSPDLLRQTPYASQSSVKSSLGSSSLPTNRKRSLDTTLDQPPAKRHHLNATNTHLTAPTSYAEHTHQVSPTSSLVSPFDSGRLPPLPATLPLPVNSTVPYLAPLNLPGSRAMSTVYQPPGPAVTNIPPVVQALPNPLLPNGHMVPINLGPRPPAHPTSTNTSPINLYGPLTPTRLGLSWRGSPYRPVTNMNTLLHPPPSAALTHAANPVSFEQMHYQPLSKNTTQPRQGPMPCLHPDAWMSHASTPTHRPF